MNLILNNETIVLAEGITIEQMLEQCNISGVGIAIGINNRVIKRADWAAYWLKDGDKITIIKATCGG